MIYFGQSLLRMLTQNEVSALYFYDLLGIMSCMCNAYQNKYFCSNVSRNNKCGVPIFRTAWWLIVIDIGPAKKTYLKN